MKTLKMHLKWMDKQVKRETATANLGIKQRMEKWSRITLWKLKMKRIWKMGLQTCPTLKMSNTYVVRETAQSILKSITLFRTEAIVLFLDKEELANSLERKKRVKWREMELLNLNRPSKVNNLTLILITKKKIWKNLRLVSTWFIVLLW